MDRHILILAKNIERNLLAGYQSYLEDCELDRSQGYRPHYCEHGTNQWTDYDNICGPCEDGISMGDGATRRRYAIDLAKERWEKFINAMNAIKALVKAGVITEYDPEYESLFKKAMNMNGLVNA